MTRNIDRRSFLKTSGAGLAALSFPLPLGTLGTTRRPDKGELPVFVCLYLRGGMDALNCVVPYKDTRYYELRPTIALAPEKTEDERGVLPLDGDWALHPALEPVLPLWEAGMFAPIVCVGSPHPTRSHFDAQDFMEYAAPGLRGLSDGWLNRYLQATTDRWGKEQGDATLRAVAMQGLLPRSLRGEFAVLAVPDERRRGRDDTEQLLDLFDELYPPKDGGEGMDRRPMGRRKEEPEDSVLASGRVTIEALRRFKQIQEKVGPGTAKYPTGGFGPRLEGIARLIRSGEPIELAAADWNGWDHHINEGAEDGRMAQMLGNLGQSVAAFFQDIGSHGKRTLVLCMTEFGRTCRENGNGGTDHGHGGVMLAFGGPVEGKKVHGKWPGLDDKELYQNRDLVVTTDFRDVFAEVMTKHLRTKKLPKEFFPDYKPGKGPGFLG